MSRELLSFNFISFSLVADFLQPLGQWGHRCLSRSHVVPECLGIDAVFALQGKDEKLSATI